MESNQEDADDEPETVETEHADVNEHTDSEDDGSVHADDEHDDGDD